MSNSKLSQKEQEELNKLENEAIIELYQIIALAHQTQDIDYLDSMISAWKYKYKKILDNPSPDFRKKIEKLLNESYSKVVEYILSQIKLKEEKKIENQRKALKELYSILSDNYDYDIVIDKIKKWETKYPYDSFLKMYQKRIDSAKREKNIEQYAFKQEEAFKDLYYGVVNRSGTIEELKEYLRKWEEKYSINDKFTIDHFIKHQSEIKRYTSNEFLISIAKKEEHILDNTITRTYDSSPTAQDSAFKKLESIIKGKHTIDEVFKWVYENNSIKFNDYYKQRIITATALDYSPKYLKTLPVPDIDLTKNVLSIEQYNKIDEIKRYAIISYFNLLLPQNEAISNNFFTEHMRTIYYESERRKHINIINTFKDEVTNFIPETLKEKKETNLNLDSAEIKVSDNKNSFNNNKTIIGPIISKDIIDFTVPTTEETKPVNDTKNEPDTIESVTCSISEIKEESDEEIITISDTENNVLDIEKLISSEEEPHTIEIVTSPEIEEPITEDLPPVKEEIKSSSIEEYTISESKSISSSTKSLEDYETETTEFITSDTDKSEKSDIISTTVSVIETESSLETPSTSVSTIDSDISTISIKDNSVEDSDQTIDYTTIVALSPDFFETINNYSIQARLVQTASRTAQKINTTTLTIDKPNNKTRNQSE